MLNHTKLQKTKYESPWSLLILSYVTDNMKFGPSEIYIYIYIFHTSILKNRPVIYYWFKLCVTMLSTYFIFTFIVPCLLFPYPLFINTFKQQTYNMLLLSRL